MILFEFAAVTAATAASIGGIVTVYYKVLKRNERIGHAASRQSQSYPNSKQKTEQKPTQKLTKVSATAKTKKNQEPKKIKEVSQSVSQIRQKVENDPAEAAHALKKFFLKQKLAKTLIEAQKSSERNEVPQRCTHHFNYLYSLKRNAEIPNECYSCSRLIQCFQKPKK